MSILTLALSLLNVAITRAESTRPVGLIIWVEDGGPVSKSSLRDELAGLRAIRPELEYRRLRTTIERSEKDLRKKLPKLLSSAGHVSNLVIGTHGSTNTDENSTVLQGFGGFSAHGAAGPLKVLLEMLAAEGKLGSHVHVYLMGCGTMRGTAEQVAERVNGLAKDLALHGVQRVSCWGARQFIVAAAYRGKIKSARDRNLHVLKMPFAAVPTALSLGYLTYYLLQTSSVLSDPLLRNISFVGLSAYPMAYVLARRLIRFDHGEDGYLTTVDRDAIRVREVDFLKEPSSAKTGRCEKDLAPPVLTLLKP